MVITRGVFLQITISQKLYFIFLLYRFKMYIECKYQHIPNLIVSFLVKPTHVMLQGIMVENKTIDIYMYVFGGIKEIRMYLW